MRVSLIFGLASAFAGMELCFRLLSSARCAGSWSFDGVATSAPIGAARFGDRHGLGPSLLSRRENTPT
jgi:hypothetical protein